jgi:hypothetical protein
VKSTKAKSFNKKHNYAFQYKQFDKKINKGKMNFQSSNATFFNPSWSNKLYFKGHDGWFYEFENQNNFKPKLKDISINEMFLKNIKIFLKKPKTQAQGLKESYQNTFVKSSKNSQTCVFCNYCCHIGHISLDCKHRKENNIVNVVWVPKIKN